jgi:hypothetical protein
MNALMVVAVQASPSPSVTRTIFTPDPPSGGDTFVAVIAIVLALAAAVVGYRIIRGGRGL